MSGEISSDPVRFLIFLKNLQTDFSPQNHMHTYVYET